MPMPFSGHAAWDFAVPRRKRPFKDVVGSDVRSPPKRLRRDHPDGGNATVSRQEGATFLPTEDSDATDSSMFRYRGALASTSEASGVDSDSSVSPTKFRLPLYPHVLSDDNTQVAVGELPPSGSMRPSVAADPAGEVETSKGGAEALRGQQAQEDLAYNGTPNPPKRKRDLEDSTAGGHAHSRPRWEQSDNVERAHVDHNAEPLFPDGRVASEGAGFRAYSMSGHPITSNDMYVFTTAGIGDLCGLILFPN
ncbi:hypothetical protein LTR37_020465 [Vermiconidia calcicola]|uniref:Uncharacterized protein n=1 Tax=Vermiconidia calcicola TaxID=1690605 RepID=A0ACC3MB71_9PEZI|nr:hypothetical protein LTR37_020465 [Vermiconidia calcicola]